MDAFYSIWVPTVSWAVQHLGKVSSSYSYGRINSAKKPFQQYKWAHIISFWLCIYAQCMGAFHGFGHCSEDEIWILSYSILLPSPLSSPTSWKGLIVLKLLNNQWWEHMISLFFVSMLQKHMVIIPHPWSLFWELDMDTILFYTTS